jgi:glc operon protein GlcG
MATGSASNAAIKGEKSMKLRTLTAIVLAAGLLAAGNAYAQQQAPAGAPDLNAVPDKMPFATPYGTPITMERAQSLIQAAVGEAHKRGWAMDVAVMATL